ncbi:hypothetical protein P175DRAFT_0476567 [Aspergillus ochraceoroseus IBT 24754]|uniref:Alpha/beta hydrolase fold-3 domain-containing protein n=2 Tax=Aspergillus ochraceoroseus TaxID=138278 RepID=A0A2T5LYT1_9EURO|nr:uncharacterized protein P175DRAFT_0476567 [Aspergillus ochraceoroseus IBT 24754]KKK18798.1 hypothetical protein AOCH_002885 [Aspergillus ochraceoroseus]PTU21448.1 hypothetical protein P175DRAFT_0476567 [Aspergillus ochraceoroseus IBT 24754]
MAYEDPETWLQLGEIDPELSELIANGIGPRFDKDYRVESIAPTRLQWDPLYKEAARKALLSPTITNVTHSTIEIPLRDGTTARTLVYQPKQQPPGARRPLVVLFHGGGFCFGCPEMEARNCIEAVQQYGAVALSVEYRLAPEHKFPTAVEDSWDALKWISSNTESLNADASAGFIVGGTSAGGNIAAILSHLARDEKLPHAITITGLWLNIPLLLNPEVVPEQYRPMYLSREQNRNAPILPEAAMRMYGEAYQPDLASHLWSPFNWPTGHQGLPRTYFQICGMDVLRDEALIYERVLRSECGVPTRVDLYAGLPHVFYANFPQHRRSGLYLNDTMRGFGWLLEAL